MTQWRPGMDCSRPFRACIAHHQTINITDIFEMILVCPNIQGNFSEGPDYSCNCFFFFFFDHRIILLGIWRIITCKKCLRNLTCLTDMTTNKKKKERKKNKTTYSNHSCPAFSSVICLYQFMGYLK